MPTIFTKIINGDIPSYKIYENELVYAFLDIRPHALGHTLVVPKTEVGNFEDLEDPYFSEVFRVAKKIAKSVKRVTSCRKVGLLVHGLGVPDRFHLHLIPVTQGHELDQDNAHTETEILMKKIQAEIVSNL